MPPGATPPLIQQYSASTVPILQLSIGSKTLPEQDLFDISNQQLRPELSKVNGTMVPWAYGGKQRYVVADLEPDKMFGYGVSASDVSAAINQQNLIIPSGTAKMGTNEYFVKLNSSPELVTAINDLPVKTINGVTVYVRDVAHVSDKYMPQTNLVHADGQKRGRLSFRFTKHGGSSTLDIVEHQSGQ